MVWESGLEGLDWNDLALNRVWRRALMNTVMNFQVVRWEVTWQVHVDPHEGFCCTVPFMNKGKVLLCTNACVLVRVISLRFDIEVLDLNQLVLHFFLCLQIVTWNMWYYSTQNFYSSFLARGSPTGIYIFRKFLVYGRYVWWLSRQNWVAIPVSYAACCVYLDKCGTHA